MGRAGWPQPTGMYVTVTLPSLVPLSRMAPTLLSTTDGPRVPSRARTKASKAREEARTMQNVWNQGRESEREERERETETERERQRDRLNACDNHDRESSRRERTRCRGQLYSPWGRWGQRATCQIFRGGLGPAIGPRQILPVGPMPAIGGFPSSPSHSAAWPDIHSLGPSAVIRSRAPHLTWVGLRGNPPMVL